MILDSAGITALYQLLYKEYGTRHWWPVQSIFEVIAGAVLTQNTAWRIVEYAKQACRKNPRCGDCPVHHRCRYAADNYISMETDEQLRKLHKNRQHL